MTDPSGSNRTARARRQRVLTDEGAARERFAGWADDGARWLTGLLAGLQAALLSLLVVVLPVVMAYIVTSADPTNQGVPWTRPVGFGAAVWLLAHGVPMTIGGDVVTLVPLGLTAVSVFACHVSARRSGHATVLSATAGVAGYTGVALVVSLLVRASVADVVLACCGAALVSAVGIVTGLARRPEAPRLRDLTRPLWSRLPGPVRTGAVAGLLAGGLLVGAAALTVLAWAVVGRDTVAQIVDSLVLDAVGGGVLAVAELAFVPTVVGWALAWLAGPGFTLGAGTSFTSGAVVSGPLPAVPLLGVLPQPDAVGGLLAWSPVLLAVAGAVAGWWLHRRLGAVQRWTEVVLAAGTCGLTAGACAALLAALASGAVGPGRMAEVGASWVLVGASVGVGVLVGALVTVVPTDATVRAAVRARLQSGRGAGRGGVPVGD